MFMAKKISASRTPVHGNELPVQRCSQEYSRFECEIGEEASRGKQGTMGKMTAVPHVYPYIRSNLTALSNAIYPTNSFPFAEGCHFRHINLLLIQCLPPTQNHVARPLICVIDIRTNHVRESNILEG